jgi:uncharacterized membrane protein
MTVPVFDAGSIPRVTPRARLSKLSKRLAAMPPVLWYALTVGLVALIVNTWQVGAASIWFDEAYSVQLAKQPVGVILGAPYGWGPEAHMTAYYVLLHNWMRALAHSGIAPSETLLRLPSALAATGAAVTLFLLAWRVTGQRSVIPALAAVAVFLAAPQQIKQAQMVRSYALETLCATLSWYALVLALHAGRRREWTLYALATVALVYAHLFGVLLVIAQGVALVALFLLWRDRYRAPLRAFLLSQMAVIVLCSALLVDAYAHGGNNGFVPPATPAAILPLLVTMFGSPVLLVVYGALGIVALIACVKPTWSRGRLSPIMPSAALFALSWALVPLALAYVATLPGHNAHLFYARYLVVTLPGWCLLAGLGIAALPRASHPLSLRLLITGALMVVVAVSVARTYAGGLELWDVRGAAKWVEARYQPGDGVVCLPSFICSVPTSYYFSLLHGPAHFDSDSPGLYHFHPAYITRATEVTITAYAGAHPRLFVMTVADNDTALHAWLDGTYERLATYTTHNMTVSLYQTTRQTRSTPPTPSTSSTSSTSSTPSMPTSP